MVNPKNSTKTRKADQAPAMMEFRYIKDGYITVTTAYGFDIDIPIKDLKKISISHNNKKMGMIPSVSLPAIITCNKNAPCAHPGSPCYAQGMEKNLLHNSIIKSYYKNLLLYQYDPDAYFLQIQSAAVTSAYFRYHVSGDIPCLDYLKRMVATAEKIKNCKFLAFTKQYQIVNKFIADGGIVPDNLIIIFSSWYKWKCKNPYNNAVCEVVDNIEQVKSGYICTGSCANCILCGGGCFNAKHGDIINIKKH